MSLYLLVELRLVFVTATEMGYLNQLMVKLGGTVRMEKTWKRSRGMQVSAKIMSQWNIGLLFMALTVQITVQRSVNSNS
jgi:hypothetical protein